MFRKIYLEELPDRNLVPETPGAEDIDRMRKFEQEVAQAARAVKPVMPEAGGQSKYTPTPALQYGLPPALKKQPSPYRKGEFTMGPTTEREMYNVPLKPGRYIPVDQLEYGWLEKVIDVPGQALTHAVNGFLLGLPELAQRKLTGEGLPAPKSNLAQVAGGAGRLGGEILGPFKIAKGVFTFGKPATTTAGRIVQSLLRKSATLGAVGAASEWQGENWKELLENKLVAGGMGAATGAVFGAADVIGFEPGVLSWALRFGASSAALDLMSGQSPFDERTLLEKAYSYGLNAYFTKNPEMFSDKNAWSQLINQAKRVNAQLKKDGAPTLPETEQATKDLMQQTAGAQPAAAPASQPVPRPAPQGVAQPPVPPAAAPAPKPQPRVQVKVTTDDKGDTVIDIAPSAPPKAGPKTEADKAIDEIQVLLDKAKAGDLSQTDLAQLRTAGINLPRIFSPSQAPGAATAPEPVVGQGEPPQKPATAPAAPKSAPTQDAPLAPSADVNTRKEPYQMTQAELKAWTVKVPEGGGSQSPHTVFTWPKDEIETLKDLSGQDDLWRFYDALGLDPKMNAQGKPVIGTPNPNIHLIDKIKRDEPITIWRASEDGPIIPGSYVSEDRNYVRNHQKTILKGKGRIYSIKVRPSELMTYGDPHEFIWVPESIASYQRRVVNEALKSGAKIPNDVLNESIESARGDVSFSTTDQAIRQGQAKLIGASAKQAERITKPLWDEQLLELMSTSNQQAVSQGQAPVVQQASGLTDWAAKEWNRRQAEKVSQPRPAPAAEKPKAIGPGGLPFKDTVETTPPPKAQETGPAIEFLPAEGGIEHAGAPVSAEALRRPMQFFIYDSARGKLSVLDKVSGVDYQPKPTEQKIQRNTATGKVEVIDRGEKARPLDAAKAASLVDTWLKNVSETKPVTYEGGPPAPKAISPQRQGMQERALKVADEFNIPRGEDGESLILYHATTKGDEIRRTGIIKAGGFSTSPEHARTQTGGQGEVLRVEVPAYALFDQDAGRGRVQFSLNEPVRFKPAPERGPIATEAAKSTEAQKAETVAPAPTELGEPTVEDIAGKYTRYTWGGEQFVDIRNEDGRLEMISVPEPMRRQGLGRRMIQKVSEIRGAPIDKAVAGSTEGAAFMKALGIKDVVGEFTGQEAKGPRPEVTKGWVLDRLRILQRKLMEGKKLDEGEQKFWDKYKGREAEVIKEPAKFEKKPAGRLPDTPMLRAIANGGGIDMTEMDTFMSKGELENLGESPKYRRLLKWKGGGKGISKWGETLKSQGRIADEDLDTVIAAINDELNGIPHPSDIERPRYEEYFERVKESQEAAEARDDAVSVLVDKYRDGEPLTERQRYEVENFLDNRQRVRPEQAQAYKDERRRALQSKVEERQEAERQRKLIEQVAPKDLTLTGEVEERKPLAELTEAEVRASSKLEFPPTEESPDGEVAYIHPSTKNPGQFQLTIFRLDEKGRPIRAIDDLQFATEGEAQDYLVNLWRTETAKPVETAEDFFTAVAKGEGEPEVNKPWLTDSFVEQVVKEVWPRPDDQAKNMGMTYEVLQKWFDPRNEHVLGSEVEKAIRYIRRNKKAIENETVFVSPEKRGKEIQVEELRDETPQMFEQGRRVVSEAEKIQRPEDEIIAEENEIDRRANDIIRRASGGDAQRHRIFKGVTEGRSFRDIAREESLSDHTVKKRFNEMVANIQRDPDLTKAVERFGPEAEAEMAKGKANMKTYVKWALSKLTDPNLHIANLWLDQLPMPIQKGVSKAFTALQDTQDWFKDMFRFPYWNETYKPIVNRLVNDIENRALKETDRSYKMAKDYFELDAKDKKAREKVDKVLMRGDAAQTVFGDGDLIGFGLTPKERAAYKGVRQALDWIQTNYLGYMMKRSGYKAGPGQDKEIKQFIKDHYQVGYFPHMRFGRFAVFVGRPWGQGKRTLLFATFETELEAQKYADSIQPTIPRKGQAPIQKEIKVVDLKKTWKDPSSFMSILHHAPIVKAVLAQRGQTDPDIQKLMDLLGEQYYGYFAQGRLAHRKNVPGWSADAARSIRQYFEKVPFSYAKRFMQPDIEAEYAKVPHEQRPYARDLIDYFYGRKKYEGVLNHQLRRVLYNFYLALKPSFGILNSTQPAVVGIPVTTSELKLAGANRREVVPILTKALGKNLRMFGDYISMVETNGKADLGKVVRDAKWLDAKDKRVMIKMLETGELGAVMQREIRGKEKGLLNIFGYLSERNDRFVSSLMGIEVAKRKGLTDTNEIFNYVRDYNRKVNFLYSQATRPELMRGYLAPLTLFKTYIGNYANMLGKLWKNDKTSFGVATALALATGGALGIPGVNEMLGLYKSVMKRHDPEFEAKYAEFRNAIDKDKKWAGVLAHGLPTLLNIEGDVVFGSPEIFGVAGLPVVQEIPKLVKGLTSDDMSKLEAFARAAPSELKHLLRAYQLKQGKMPTDIYGRPKLTPDDLKAMPKEMRAKAVEIWQSLPKAESIPALEKALYAIGFPTKEMSRYGRGVMEVKQLARDVKDYKVQHNRRIGQVLAEGLQGKYTYAYFKELKPSEFGSSFWSFVRKLEPEQQAEIKEIIAEAKKNKIKLSMSSVLDRLREMLYEE